MPERHNGLCGTVLTVKALLTTQALPLRLLPIMSDFILTLTPLRAECPAPAARTLLASAEAAGIDLPTSCRNGSCRTCLAHLSAGSVRHTVEWPGLSRDEKEAGWILPCVAVPLSDVVLAAPAARRRQ